MGRIRRLRRLRINGVQRQFCDKYCEQNATQLTLLPTIKNVKEALTIQKFRGASGEITTNQKITNLTSKKKLLHQLKRK